MRRPVAIRVVAAGALALAAACGKEAAEEVKSTAAVAVRTAEVRAGSIRGLVRATGTVAPAPGADLVVVAPEPARIAAIPHAAGDRVRKGDLLVRFEIPGPAADVDRQRAEVTRAEAAIASAKAAHARARDLFARGIAARKEVEEAERALAEAEAARAQAEASARAAETIAGRAVVRAAFDGVVVKRSHNPGDLVDASASDPVLRVVDPDRLEVVASVPLSDAMRVNTRALAHLVMSTAMPLPALRVASRPVAVEADSPTVAVRLTFEGHSSLPVGMPVQVEIESEQHDAAALVPAAALVREGTAVWVYVAGGGKAARRAVETGITDGAQVEILSGVRPAERVIIDGQAGLPDGAAITEVASAGAAPPEKDPPK